MLKLQDERVIDLLKQGAFGVLPTDTVYGLVCLASNQATVKRLYNLKSRENKLGFQGLGFQGLVSKFPRSVSKV